jgi:carbon-monoxide dehydrogenase large subunit
MALAGFSWRPQKRLEDDRLLKGEGRFVEDVELPGMLHAFVVRSLEAHAHLLNIDASAALAMPGVVAVLTAADLKGVVTGIPVMSRHGAAVLPGTEHPVLARNTVCYVGQPLGVIAAESRLQAEDAAEHVVVTYDPLPPVIDAESAEAAAAIHPEVGTNAVLRIEGKGGDIDAAFGNADGVVRGRFEIPRVSPAPMETRGVVAEYDPAEQRVTLNLSTQVPYTVRDSLAQVMGLRSDQVRVVAPDVGGGFGQKHQLFPEDVAVACLARALGRPVRWIEERRENMVACHGRGYLADLEAAFTSDGKILGLRGKIIADLGGFAHSGAAISPHIAVTRLTGPYAIDAVDVKGVGVMTNMPPVGPYRGAGQPEAAFFMERIIDSVAGKLGLDPASVRSRNLIPQDAFPYDTISGLVYDDGDFERTLDRALELSHYDRWREVQRQQSSDGNLRIGVGVATVTTGSGGAGRSRDTNARVRIEPSGEVVIVTEASPHGQGVDTALAQIAADVLSISPERVRIQHGDTDMLPWGRGTYGSRSLILSGSAAYLALQEARDKVLRIGAYLLGRPPEGFEVREGRVVDKEDPSIAVSMGDVTVAAQQAERLPPDMEPGLEFYTEYTMTDNAYSFAAHVAIVEVDRTTGDVALLRYVAVHDSGPLMNPMLAEGQIHGGVVQGIGQALSEAMLYDEGGQVRTGSFMDYAVPYAAGLPPIVVDTVSTPSSSNPLGVRGIGEAPAVAAPAAVANAVHDALVGEGVGSIGLPLTPERVWKAIEQAKRR